MTIPSKARKDTDMDEKINEIIQAKLSEIEEKENVKILHCVESGSRAWGFPSPDSDYDVRFIYVRDRDHYLKLEKTRDVIEWQLDETLDINGWDLQKTLRLLHNSNPTVFEWSNSPVVYRTTEEWANLSEIILSCFDPKAGIYHYLNTAKNNYKAYFKSDRVKLKKYFYVLRPLLAANWISDKNTPPPVLFSELIDTELDDKLRPLVDELLEEKKRTSEIGEGKRVAELDSYINYQFEKLDGIVKSMNSRHNADIQTLNKAFLKLLF